tara:strand:- start:125 stop:646 length:522 start_codon:yes stop_codon:yes gene_type:complete
VGVTTHEEAMRMTASDVVELQRFQLIRSLPGIEAMREDHLPNLYLPTLVLCIRVLRPIRELWPPGVAAYFDHVPKSLWNPARVTLEDVVIVVAVHPDQAAGLWQGFPDRPQEVAGMLELVSKRVVMLACVDAGCCCFEKVATVDEVGEAWANVIEQLHQPCVSHRTREGRVAA